MLLVLLLAGSCTRDDPALGSRQQEIAERGARVMPFDLDRTTHHFEPTLYGGVQHVVADDPLDKEQVRLIRAHLQKEAGAFARGDFSDPEKIHGQRMPGLPDLRAGYERIDLRYSSIPAGARIVYRTQEEDLISALHRWFEAQLMDHGDHAEDGS